MVLECEQFNCPGEAISLEKAGRLSLGFFPPRMHNICGWYTWATYAKWLGATGTYRFLLQ